MKYKERNPEKRINYIQDLRRIISIRGSHNIVYVDEWGFDTSVYRRYGWSLRGKKVYCERSGHRRPITSLISARRGKEFLAPMLFLGTTNGNIFKDWLRDILCKELRPGSTIILYNASFHKNKYLEAIAHNYGHEILFFPPYSPDFNPIEQYFANIKKIRRTPTLCDIIKSYENYWK